jgi:uncharacterized protein YbjT (DUF2867 family)
MLVVVGANGRTGLEIVREALDRGLHVKAVVRDDRDATNLDDIIDVQQISYADPEHHAPLAAALVGATAVIICIDPRTGGPGTPIYHDQAAPNVVMAAKAAGAKTIIYMSVMGAFRWSPNSLNRRAFHLDRGVRAQDAPWTVLRVSTYIDELIEGHVRPPDGKTPHRISRSSRYSPVSRRDVAAMALDYLSQAVAGRQVCLGGPEVFSGIELEEKLKPWRVGRGRKTKYYAVPAGDVSVTPDATRVTIGRVPKDRLDDFLDPSSLPSKPTDPPPVYARPIPGPHSADAGKSYKIQQPWGPTLRRVIHDQLTTDLGRLGLDSTQISLDFSRARKAKGQREAQAHEGTFTILNGVRVVDKATDMVIHSGAVDFVRDKNAEIFHCWWASEGIPETVWREFDMGVQRRMVAAGVWADDPLVLAFRK